MPLCMSGSCSPPGSLLTIVIHSKLTSMRTSQQDGMMHTGSRQRVHKSLWND